MAQLPRYKRESIQYKGMPSLTTAATQQQLASNERLNKFLGEATQYFQAEAIDYATDKAIEDAIRNPITAEQLEQARQTGGNPIERYLQGGTKYNEAITKTLGQQVAGEMDLELQRSQNAVLEDVRLGKIENSEEMLAKLTAPIQAQVEFFSTVDPEMARAYGANAAATARNKFLQGETIFGELKEKSAFLNAKESIQNAINDYDTYLLENPDASVAAKQLYKETKLQITTDTSLSMSRKQLELSEDLINELSKVEDEYVAKAIASEYKGETIDEVLKSLPEAKGSNADYFKGKNILQQNQLASRISNYLDIENSGLAAIKQQVTRNINDAKGFIENGQLIDPNLADSINNNIDKDSVQYQDWLIIQGISDNMSLWNNTSMSVLTDTYDMMNANRADINVIQPRSEQITQNALGSYIKNLQTSLKNDMVGTILSRSGKQSRLNFNDPAELSSQTQERRAVLDQYGPLYGLTKPQYAENIMTKEETSAFLGQYMAGTAQTKVQMLANLDAGFGDNSSQAMLQLTKEGLPITAELSSFFQDPRMTEQFMSYDMPEEQDRLKKYAKQSDTSYQKIQAEVRLKLEEFEDVVMNNNKFNTGPAIAKLDSMVNALSYHAISIMSGQNKDAEDAVEMAANTILNSFELTDNYFVPNKYNGRPVSTDEVINKANLIKDFYLSDFDPVPYPSTIPGVTDEMLAEALNENLAENGRWANTADGSGLVYGTVFSDGSFAPIKNKNGDELRFNFNDVTYTLPNTDIELINQSRGIVSPTMYYDESGAPVRVYGSSRVTKKAVKERKLKSRNQ